MTTDTTVGPGVHVLPEADYFADPIPEGSLSVSGAKTLLPPGCPALFKWQQEHGRPDKRTFDFGHAAHALVLGVGREIVVIDADDYRTNAAKAARDDARENGACPVLRKEMATVEAMAAAIRQHPIASVLLTPGSGTPEASLFWRDTRTSVMRRGRLDWLPDAASGRLIIPDYKTADCAEPSAFARSAANFRYHMQAAWYCDGVTTLGIAEDVAFVFVVQEKTPPYLVSVVELDSLALRIGRHFNDKAIDIYAHCRTTDEWPGYDTDVALVSLPGWVEREYEQETAA